MNWARVLAVAGVATFALGLVTLVDPGLFVLGAERIVVVAVGLLALVQLLRVVQIRRRGTIRRAGTADPELPAAVDQPGERLDAVLRRFDPDRYRYGAGRRRKVQVETLAVEALTRYRNCTESEARELIASGAWTDDPIAAAFLGDDGVGSLPLRYRLRVRLSGDSPYRRGIRRSIAAIAAVAGLRSGDDDGDGGGSRTGLPALRGGFDDRVETGDPPSEWDEHRDSTRRRTGHWRGISAAALAGIGVGVLAEQATVILVGVVGISYAAYARSTSFPAPELSIDRSVEPERPSPDETVEVTVTVANDGDRALPDLRLVDGVPPGLAVVDGAPRLGTSLPPGGTASFSYAVDAHRGAHEFDPVHVVSRNLSGTVEYERTATATGAATVTCVPPLEAVEAAVPVRRRPSGLAGRERTSIGGSGTEFFSTRTYRPGDPMHRIDWNRRAKSGELATLEFREERTVTAVLVVDATDSAAVGPEPRGPDAVDRSVGAAARACTALLDEGNRVGLAALADRDCWVPPGAGETHRTRLRERLATDPAFATGVRSRPAVPSRWLTRLRSRLPADGQVVLFSPLCSDLVARLATQLDAHGYPVTVVSPDPTVSRTAGNQVAALVRRFRISDLRAADVPVVDWGWNDPLAVAFARSPRRWSR